MSSDNHATAALVRRAVARGTHRRGALVRNAEVVMGIERVKAGEARLHWWKDRDGDLEVPLSSFWPMLFDRRALFQWDASADSEAA